MSVSVWANIIFSERRSPWRRFLETFRTGARDNPLKFELALGGALHFNPPLVEMAACSTRFFVFQNARRLRRRKAADFFLKIWRRRFSLVRAGRSHGRSRDVLIIHRAASV